MREIISCNLKSTILKMGLNVNVLAEPLLQHYKSLDINKFSFASYDFQLIEFMMLTIEYDNEIFRLFMEVIAKLLMATTLFSKNLINLVTNLIGAHESQSITVLDQNNRYVKVSFYDHLLKLVKILTKDIIDFEKSLKEKQSD